VIDSSYFYFKGERNYIQAGNIFDSIIADMKKINPQNIDFKLTRMTVNKWYIERGESQVVNGYPIGHYKDNNSDFLIMESKEPVIDRRDYCEKILVRCFHGKKNVIEVPNSIDTFTFIEKANAAFKALLRSSVLPNVHLHYIFVRLILKYIPEAGFTIKYKRKIGRKFFEGEIFEKGASIGFIYFAGEDNS